MLYYISTKRAVFNNESNGVIYIALLQIVVYLSDRVCPCLHECPVVSGQWSEVVDDDVLSILSAARSLMWSRTDGRSWLTEQQTTCEQPISRPEIYYFL